VINDAISGEPRGSLSNLSYALANRKTCDYHVIHLITPGRLLRSVGRELEGEYSYRNEILGWTITWG